MNIHVCKQCGSRFEYCRACVFRPIRYKDKGFCSKECYEASKNVVKPVVELEPVVEEIPTVEVIVENSNEPLVEDIEPIMEETPEEAETEAVVLSEVSDIEEAIQIIENETDDIYEENEYLVRE